MGWRTGDRLPNVNDIFFILPMKKCVSGKAFAKGKWLSGTTTFRTYLIQIRILVALKMASHALISSVTMYDCTCSLFLCIYIVYIYVYIHSFIPDIYIAPLQETYSEALSLQLQSKRNVLRSLQKEDTLFWGSKRSVRGSCMHAYINTLIHVWLLFFVLYLFYYCFLSFQFYLTLLRMMRLAKKP